MANLTHQQPGTDLAALHEALDAATLAAVIAEASAAEVTGEALAIASAAADMAFPEGSAGLVAFRTVLAAIADEAAGTCPASRATSPARAPCAVPARTATPGMHQAGPLTWTGGASVTTEDDDGTPEDAAAVRAPAALFGPVLASHLQEGCRLAYHQDAGAMWAELRRPDGRLVECGTGATAGEALEHLQSRLGGAK